MTRPRRPAPLVVRRLGLCDYEPVLHAMQRFAEQHRPGAPDELWVVQHPPVYTRGLNCRLEPLRPSAIPVVATDRGGQITYHGPGQVVVYTLLDIRRRRFGVKGLVSLLEESVIKLLSAYGIAGQRRQGAPGVYVAERKIAALGIRIRHGCSYHGLSLNVDMDLAPFRDIDPCGHKDLEVTQLRDLGVADPISKVEQKLVGELRGLVMGDG